VGVAVKGKAVSSLLLVREKGTRRMALIVQVNNWLWSWCWQQSFGFHNHETKFRDQRLLRRDEILTNWGKAMFENWMADLVSRAFS